MCVISSEPGAERREGSELRAETWRAHPSFELGEVTMTRLGNVHSLFLPKVWVRPLTGAVHGSEEAEGVIVMVSDWLELDASDSWVRHDSEIVSVHHYLCRQPLGGFSPSSIPTPSHPRMHHG